MRTIEFAGYEWQVKEASKAGPGPNAFSSREEDIFAAEDGLHLRTAHIDRRWHATEAVMPEPLGFGEYSFTVAGGLALLPVPYVFAGFLYQDDRHELDIEFSREMVENANAQFAVQPGWLHGHKKTFEFAENGPSAHAIRWSRDAVEFESAANGTNVRWKYVGHFKPAPESALFIFNLWLYRGRPAERPAEVVVTSFSFKPY